MSTQARWQAVNALFDEVVDLAAEAREERLKSWTGDPAIADEVRSLLTALARADVTLEPSPGASHLTLLGKSAVLPITLTGRRLGPWAVVREVGRGGMGAVYEAFRADDQYQKRVAVKTLTRGADSEVVARRFQQERQILASLEHPSIATLIDGGVTEEGLPYLVMEFVDGEPIDRYCASHKVGLRQRLDLFRQVCAAVQHAHRNLVVHRDLKPSNVLVTGNGDVKLVDFGIAKLMGDQPGAEVTLTEAGQRAFTTGYASPEQVRGETISTSSDVYSLGATLFRLLTGRLPVDVSKVTPSEALRRISEATPPPPSRVATDGTAREMGLENAGELADELAGELDDIVLAALRKEPERRYGTVAAFSDDLKRYLQGQQVSARPDTWRYRVSSFTRRNPKFVVAMVVAGLSLALGTVLAGWQAVRAGQERDKARAEASRSSRVVSFIEQLLAAPVQGELTDATIASLDQAVARSRGELADDPVARAAVYRTAANAYASHNRDELALPLVDSALILDRRHTGERSTEVGRDLIITARVAYNRGILDSAVIHARQAVEILKAAPSDRPEDLSRALLYHSFALTYAGQAPKGEEIAREGLQVEAPRASSAAYAYLQMALGEALLFQGKYAEADSGYAASAAAYEALGAPQPVERGIAELGLGTLRLDLGRPADAERHARKSLEVFTEHWGKDHAYTGRAHSLLALVAAANGDSASIAIELAAAFKALEKSRLGVVDWISIETSLARTLMRLGRNEEAMRRLQAALAARPGELARAPQILSTTESMLALALMNLHRPAEAWPILERVHQRAARIYGPESPITRSVASRALFVASALGDSAGMNRYAVWWRK